MDLFGSSTLSTLMGSENVNTSLKGRLLLKTYDDDGDGKLSSREAAMGADRFAKADQDGDGGLSEKELAISLARNERASLGSVDLSALARALLSRKDGDGDDALTAAEVGLTSSRFADTDKNGDGLIDAGELADHLEKGVAGSKGLASSTPEVKNYRSVALEGAMSLLGGKNFENPWYSSSSESSKGWFG